MRDFSRISQNIQTWLSKGRRAQAGKTWEVKKEIQYGSHASPTWTLDCSWLIFSHKRTGWVRWDRRLETVGSRFLKKIVFNRTIQIELMHTENKKIIHLQTDAWHQQNFVHQTQGGSRAISNWEGSAQPIIWVFMSYSFNHDRCVVYSTPLWVLLKKCWVGNGKSDCLCKRYKIRI